MRESEREGGRGEDGEEEGGREGEGERERMEMKMEIVQTFPTMLGPTAAAVAGGADVGAGGSGGLALACTEPLAGPFILLDAPSIGVDAL